MSKPEQMTFDQVTEMEWIGGDYEYGVVRYGELHRGPYRNQLDAQRWVDETEALGFRKGVFKVVRRRVGDWHEVAPGD